MGRGLQPAHRVRDSRGLSDADWNTKHARVYLPKTNGGYVKAWVKIEKGDCFQGQGIVDDKVDSPITLGTPIAYRGGNDAGVLPKYEKRLHRKNKKEVLLKGVADQLARSMQMKP